MVHLIWFHGWGFDSNCFAPLIKELPDFQHHQVDQGYFGAPSSPTIPQGTPCIAIGHSLGFAHALESPLPIKGYISLCGFYQFCATPLWPWGIPAKIMARMVAKFKEAPMDVLQDFYHQCHGEHIIPPLINKERLEEDLTRLKNLHIPHQPDLLLGAIAGELDQITPLTLQQSLFKDLIIIPESGHLPWVKNALLCADPIRHWCNKLSHDQTTNSP